MSDFKNHGQSLPDSLVMSHYPTTPDSSTMSAALIGEDFTLSVETIARPPLPAGGAVIKVLGCGFCGSDLDKVVHRKAAPGTVLGHEVVGVIADLSPKAAGSWKTGQRVVVSHHVPCGECRFCRQDSESMCSHFKATNLRPGGFAEYTALSAGHLQHTAFPVPDGIEDGEASCVEPLACVLRAFRRDRKNTLCNSLMPAESASPLNRGSSAQSTLVIGLGFIGLLAAMTYSAAGDSVYGADIDIGRMDWAKKQGLVRDAFDPSISTSQDPQLAAQRGAWIPALLPESVDTVFLSAVNASSLTLAMACVRDGGNIVLFASPSGNMPPPVDLAALYFREINLITSYSPALLDLRDSASLVFSRTLPVRSLISEHTPLAGIGEALERYRTGKSRKAFIQIQSEVEAVPSALSTTMEGM